MPPATSDLVLGWHIREGLAKLPGLFRTGSRRLRKKQWRRGWDSNPRYGFPYARFRGEYFQPLSHLSAVVATSIVTRVLFSGNLALLSKILAAGGEEGLKDGCALGSEHAGNGFHLMIESGVSQDFETGTNGAAL